MSRPKSMSDFASLFDASMPPPLHPYDKSREHPRKKPSISLAAGLIMASVETHSPRTSSSTSNGTNTTGQDGNQKNRDAETWSEGLFYAYAQKDTTPPTPPSVLTFSSAHTASQWWSLVQTAYPTSTRPSPQFFILRTTSSSPSMPTLLDPLTQILQNPHFAHLNNKWFFTTPSPDSPTPSPPIIPLQTSKGHPLSAPPIPLSTPPPPPPQPQPTPEIPSLHALLSSLETLTTLTTENTTQIHALTTAQSASLTTTQQYYETTSSQLRTLASTQSSLQSLLASTTRTTKTLSSAHAALQDESRKQSTTVVALGETQNILLQTSQALVEAVDALTTKVQFLSKSTPPPPAPAAAAAPESPDSLPTTPLRAKSNSFALSDASTLTPSSSPPFMFPQQALTHRTRISPPPRKLNRRIKGVWYEYDMTTPISAISTPTSVSVASTPSKSVSSNATSTPKMVSSTTPRSVPTFDPGKMAKPKSNTLGSGLRTATMSVKGKA